MLSDMNVSKRISHMIDFDALAGSFDTLPMDILAFVSTGAVQANLDNACDNAHAVGGHQYHVTWSQ